MRSPRTATARSGRKSSPVSPTARTALATWRRSSMVWAMDRLSSSHLLYSFGDGLGGGADDRRSSMPQASAASCSASPIKLHRAEVPQRFVVGHCAAAGEVTPGAGLRALRQWRTRTCVASCSPTRELHFRRSRGRYFFGDVVGVVERRHQLRHQPRQKELAPHMSDVARVEGAARRASGRRRACRAPTARGRRTLRTRGRGAPRWRSGDRLRDGSYGASRHDRGRTRSAALRRARRFRLMDRENRERETSVSMASRPTEGLVSPAPSAGLKGRDESTAIAAGRSSAGAPTARAQPSAATP